MVKRLVYAGLIVLSLLAAIKMMILGLNIDEEYAITMSYRMADGDRMFLEMWEPHQTSGFACALFIKVYTTLFHTTDYLVLFLRGIGVLIQGLVSVFVFTTLKKHYSFDIAFYVALICFNVLPKWILVPEFSNLMLWCSLCVWMCLLRYAWNVKNGKKWLLPGALFYCGMVLTYPSCLILFPIYIFGIYKITPAECRKNIWIFPCICAGAGVLYLTYFLSHMSFSELVFGIQQMLRDGSHAYGMAERLAFYGKEVLEFVIPVVLILLLAAVLGRKLGKLAFGATVIILACIHQWLCWMGPEIYLNLPLLFFYLVFGIGAFYVPKDKGLFYLGYIPAGGAVLAVLLLTNTTLGFSGVQLLPGMMCTCICLLQVCETQKLKSGLRVLCRCSCFILLALFMFAKGWLVNETAGYKADALFVKQKALYGPAKNIYCRYAEGYAYNALAESLDGAITEKDSVLYIGIHSLRYLLTDAKISAYSTISTPTFDERLREYWECFPDRYPTVIMVEKESEAIWEDISLWFDDTKLLRATEDIKLYATERYIGNAE